MIIDLVVDYETVGYAPDGVCLDFAAVPFIADHENPPTFEELVESAFYAKFDITSQEETRVIDDSVCDFWLEQPEEARIILDPTEQDVGIVDGHAMFIEWCKRVNIDPYKSEMWSTGNEFDIGIMTHVLRTLFDTRDLYNFFPVRFWNVRDTRTSISENLGRSITKAPIRKELLNGFIRHNSIHDCAAAALQVLYARRYAFGLEPMPEEHECHPHTLMKRK